MKRDKKELLEEIKKLRQNLKEKALLAGEKSAARHVLDYADAALMDYAKQLREGKQYDEGFLALWESYPRKVGKDKAYTAYKKAIKSGASPEQLVRAAQDWGRTDQWSKGYIPYLANWLNDGKWQEDTRRLPKAKQMQYMERGTAAVGGYDPTEE